MTLVAPINLPFNVKTLWFDPNGIDVKADDKVVVSTARGLELGVAASDVIDVPYEKVAELSTPLKPVERIATEADIEKAAEMQRLSKEAMPVFKELARETSEDMHPVSVEYMLDGDKAVFYFESEKRIDFRELVRKLASTFHVRIDMRQIGVRDEARIVGGIAHCGQLVCCKRLGGEFNPVSIKMAKHQDLSLNQQKISGLCGRLMCCLRYEDEVYEEFKARAPKIGAKVATPDGEGRVVEHDVPRELLAVRIEDGKPIKVPLSAFYDISEDKKSCAVRDDAWADAVEAANSAIFGGAQLIDLPSFTGEDKLGSSKAVMNAGVRRSKETNSPAGSRAENSCGGCCVRRSKEQNNSANSANSSNSANFSNSTKRMPRRRSTKISGESGSKETTAVTKETSSQSGKVRPGQKSSALSQGREKSDERMGDGGRRKRKRGKRGGANSRPKDAN